MKRKQVLLTSGSASSVNRIGGKFSVTGIEPISERDILSVELIPSTDEVQKVESINNGTTVVAGQTYIITVDLPSHEINGAQASQKRYAYVAPDILSGNATTDRTLMFAALAAKINADSTAYITAVATAGTSLVLTDNAGYYPARPASRGGASIINLSGGWTNTTGVKTITTNAVYAFGIGDDFVSNKPVYHQMTGNLSSGESGYPTNAVAGQKYDAYVIGYSSWANHNAVAGMASKIENQLIVWVDNGKGTATTNLANSRTFLNAITPIMKQAYGSSRANIIEGFNASCITSGSASGTAFAQNTIVGPNGSVFSYLPLATSTITAPASSTSGLQAKLDATDGEGVEFTTSTTDTTAGFVAGTNAASIKVIASIDDVIGLAEFAIGFRKQAAALAVIDNYTDMAVLNTQAGTINIETILNNAATTTTDSTRDWNDTEIHEIEVRVGIDRIARFYVDGVDVTDEQTANFTFDSGDVLIPFVHALQAAGLGTPVITSIVATVK